MTQSGDQILLSYAREDFEDAVRVYRALVEVNLNVWFDRTSLLPGQRWRDEISAAIRQSRYFLALLSSHSVEKTGFVQAETRKALDVLLEFPPRSVYIIPVRLDDCVPLHEALQDLHWVNLYEDWGWGMKLIKSSITSQLGLNRINHQGDFRAKLTSPPLPFLVRYDGIYIGSYSEEGQPSYKTVLRFFPGGELVYQDLDNDGFADYGDLTLSKARSLRYIKRAGYSTEGDEIKVTSNQQGDLSGSGGVRDDYITFGISRRVDGKSMTYGASFQFTPLS
ncbi:MAG TPA: toll/interleukin-1 receptor domain-containing protein [Thermoanaerobaculia bacterium]|nr:toll/interleukin-1 receptor domain-containing protein [Thermoanaerobaculia bacterium]